MDTSWDPPRLWLLLLALARGAVAALTRLHVTGDVPAHLRRGPLLLAGNHISPFDPVVLAAACRRRGIAPRIMATGGLFRAPLVGAVMRHSGHIRVDRHGPRAAHAIGDAADAVARGSVVLVYPEGRISLDPGLWPERGKTGAARLALTSGAMVVPVVQWGSHEVLPYRAPRGALPAVLRALRRRPVVRVHFGAPVDLSDLNVATPGDARKATDRIVDALVVELTPLRRDEPDLPRHVDPSRPVDTARAHPRPAVPGAPPPGGSPTS